MRIGLAAILVLVAVSGSAAPAGAAGSSLAANGADDIVAFPDSDAKPATPGTSDYSIDTPIETLAADPAAAAVVERNIPGLLSNDAYPLFKSMSLRAVGSMSGGQITNDMLTATDTELGGLSLHPDPAP